MAGAYQGGRKGPKQKRTLRGTTKERAAIMAEVAQLPEVVPVERMTSEAGERVLEFIAAGGSVTEFAERAGLPAQTVFTWLRRHAGERYAEARAAGCEALAEQVQRIALTPMPMDETIRTTDADGRVTTTVKTADNVPARKVATWALMELMKAWSPDRYGKRVTVEAGGRMAEAIAAARSRVANDTGARRPVREAEVIDVEPTEPGALF